MAKPNCLFCSIIKREMQSAIVFENSEFIVILDKFPAAKGHTLIMPKEHVENIYDLDTEKASNLFVLATHVARVLKQTLKCEGMNLVQNNGKIAGQTIPHFHLHLIPRYEGDSLNFNWVNEEANDEELRELARKVGNSI